MPGRHAIIADDCPLRGQEHEPDVEVKDENGHHFHVIEELPGHAGS